MRHFLPAKKQARKLHRNKNPFAEELATTLDAEPMNLTRDGQSWYILAKAWMPSRKEDFEKDNKCGKGQ